MQLAGKLTTTSWVKMGSLTVGVGDMAKYYILIFFLQYHDFITILTILSEQCSQTNFPIIKTKPFKVTKY